MGSVIVLGAKGRFGRAVVTAFAAAGWQVTGLARSWRDAPQGIARVTADVTDMDALRQACAGHDLIVHAVHPPYHLWPKTVPLLTRSVIAAAKATGATVAIPGNIYNYGTAMPPVLREDTPWVADTRKGAIRIRMENAFRDSGVRTIVLRMGDFIEGPRTGNWFEDHIAAKAREGQLKYPGPMTVLHAWAFLPDAARALALLAEQRASFDRFEEFGFAGSTLTGQAMADAVATAVGRPVRVRPFPWAALRVMGLSSPLMREVREMRYLWQVPHQIDGAKLRATLPDFRATPAADVIAQALAPHRPAQMAPAGGLRA